MSTSDAPNLRRLARQLADYGRRLRHLETVPQLSNSSLDDHGMPVYDADGNLTVTIGKQADGTWGAPPVRGPVPPQPAGVEADGDAGVIRASWQGVFWAGAAKPMYFEAVEVLVDGAVYAGIHDPQGGSVSVPALPGVRTVSFRTLSQAGVVSAAIGHAQVTVEPRVSEQMQELHESLDELNDVTLPELRDDLAGSAADLQGKLDSLNARVDDLVVDGGGSGNFTTYSINEPSGDGTGEGDQWFRVVNGEVLGQWRWDGTAWQAVTLTDAIIAGIDLSKLVSNGNLSEIVANKMFTDLFAANKITSQEIAAGSITTEKIAAEGIIANVIQGGAFTGETFEGGSFVGGEFRTSDTLPGRVTLADDAYINSTTGVAHPGIRVEPLDTSGMVRPPGIGPGDRGLYVDGGSDTSGRRSYLRTSPTASLMRTFREGGKDGGVIQTSPAESLMRTFREDGTTGGLIQTSPTASVMRTFREDGTNGGLIQTSPDSSRMRTYSGNSEEQGWVQVQPQDAELAYVTPDNTYFSRIKTDAREAFLYTRAGGAHRYLTVDADGIWVKTNKGGSWKNYNLEETAQDSGWNSFPVRSGITAGQDLAWRNKNGVIYFRGTVQATWSAGWNTVVTGLPTEMRPSSTIVTPSPNGSETGLLMQMTPGGNFLVFKPTAGGRTMFVSSMIYVTG